MLNDLQICDLLQAQYDGHADQFDSVNSISGVDYAIKDFGDSFHICFEGSHDAEDWLSNLECVMTYPQEIGSAGVERGFWHGLTDVFDLIAPHLPRDRLISIEGHSRGGGHSDPFAALLIHRGYSNLQIVTFGRPDTGDGSLARTLSVIPNRSYWNYHSPLEHDEVGDVPPKLVFPYQQSSQRILIDETPVPDDPWLFLKWHHLFLYRRGLAKLFAA